MAQPLCKRTRLATSSGLGTFSGISEDMDVIVTTENRSVKVQEAGALGPEGNGKSNSDDMDITTENRSVELQGAGAQGPEGNGQSNFDDKKRCLIESENFKQLLRKSGAFVDKTLFIKDFLEEIPNEESDEELDARNILITAPSRFGKSVIMNTLKVFCEPEVDEKGYMVTCLEKKAGKWVEVKNKTPPKNYALFKTIIRGKPLQIYSCTCRTKHKGVELENGTCESRQFFYQHCGQHPVIFLSLKNISPDNWERLLRGLKESLCKTYKQHMYLGDEKQSRLPKDMREDFNLFCNGNKLVMKEGEKIISELDESDLLRSLDKLVEYLYLQFGKKVLILIDEFDAPLIQLLHNSESIELKYIEKIIEYIGIMTSSVLKGNEQVLGGLINACFLLGTTILPYANNVAPCLFLENHFSEYYGLTKTEVDDLLTIHQLKDSRDTILSYYNGYSVFGTDIDLYNTYSVLKYLDDWKVQRQREKSKTSKSPDKKKHMARPRSYFSRYGIRPLNKLFAIEGIREKLNDVITNNSIDIKDFGPEMTPENVLALKKVMLQPAKVNDDDANLFLQYMKDRGYFNIIEKSENGRIYAIPNGEVKYEIMSGFYNASYYKERYNISQEMIDNYGRAIIDLDRNNQESFQKFADSIRSLFSGNFKPMNHQFEISGVLYTLAKYVEKFDVVSCEPLCQEDRNYRCDLLLIRKDGTGIIIEIKWLRGSALGGLKQIFNNEYYKVFEQYKVTKDKIYIGVYINHLGVTICAFGTSNEKVVEKFIDIREEELITKTSKFS